MAYLQAIIVHVYKLHCNQPSPNQCDCGFIGAKPEDLDRHQRSHGHSGRMQPDYEVPASIMYREANSKEKKEFKAEKRRREEEGLDRVQQDKEGLNQEQEHKAIPTVTNTMGLGLDYRDWDETETTEEESWSQIAKKCKSVEEENEQLKTRVNELKKISEVLAAEMLEPAIGVSTAAALSGFDTAWAEEQQRQNRPYHSHSLFPEPLRSVVVVPERNMHLSKNQRIWRQSCQDSIRKYNQRHK